ncbi:MAG: immunity 22 family protein [Thermoanaerobaculia bacterium]
MPLESTFNEEGQIVSVWLGRLGSQDALDAFLAEQYDDEQDDEPVSAFAAEIGLSFYDHDFFESSFHQRIDSASAFDGHSYAESFKQAAWQVGSQLRDGVYDTLLLLYGYDHEGRQPQLRASAHLAFVGTFPYQESSAGTD